MEEARRGRVLSGWVQVGELRIGPTSIAAGAWSFAAGAGGVGDGGGLVFGLFGRESNEGVQFFLC